METVGVAKVQTPDVDAKNLSTPSSFHAFSGAADGADTEWKEVAKLWGIDNFLRIRQEISKKAGPYGPAYKVCLPIKTRLLLMFFQLAYFTVLFRSIL